MAEGNGEDADRAVKRRDRLQKLRGQRAEVPRRANGGLGRMPAATAPSSEGPGGLGGPSPSKQRAMSRAYKVLTETPADEAGLVDGTPFTAAGVARLMESLRSRAGNDGAGGARAASRILQFLAPSGDGGAQVHDVSVEKLQRFARIARGLTNDGPSKV
jgi:hypothetical protein